MVNIFTDIFEKIKNFFGGSRHQKLFSVFDMVLGQYLILAMLQHMLTIRYLPFLHIQPA